MNLSDRVDGKEGPPSYSKEPATSFHGWLLDRSKTELPDHRSQKKLVWLAEQWGWLGLVLEVGALVGGSLAIGLGMLLGGDGRISSNRAMILMVGGVACVILGVLGLVAQWLIVRSSAQGARG